jgi:hypothetical protein
VDEFADAHDFWIARQTVLEPVFHGFDIVIGAGLDGFDGVRIRDRKIGNNRVQLIDRGVRKFLAFRDFSSRSERLEPFDFDPDAIADEPVFREMNAQALDLCSIATVERRKRSECSECHVFGK